jgi:hypothetical protein
MPHRPDEDAPEPDGGGAAERLRQHLDARLPKEEWPDATPEQVRDTAEEPSGETPPNEDDTPDEEASGEAVEGVDSPDGNLVAPDDRGEPRETSWQEEDWSESEDPQQ